MRSGASDGADFGGKVLEQEMKRPDGIAAPLLTASNLSGLCDIRHGFTTREGGVSEGYLSSLNLGPDRGDDPERVAENFRRVCRALGTTPDRIVRTRQEHTNIVRAVGEADAGKGITKHRDPGGYDGLVTDTPGLVLSVYVADCVPVLIADPVRRAIGAVHSGWRGTVARIAKEAIRMMETLYGTDPKDLICAIGPSIGKECYEVSADVAEQFLSEFPPAENGVGAEEIAAKRPEKEDKYLLDLKAANRRVLREAGVPAGQIETLPYCTCCEPEKFFSHRATEGKRGNLGAFLMLTE